MKKKYFLLLISSLILLLGLGLNVKTVKAAAPAQAINYSVSPEPAKNQINKKVGYYDLKMTPNQKETIKFKINNNDAIAHTYKVSFNRATTNSNGVIDYTDHDKKDTGTDLQDNIEDLVTYPKKVSVAAKTSKEVAVQVQMPAGKITGELLGGILVAEDNQVNSKKVTKGVTLKNRYEYVLGLQLQQNTDPVKPELKLNKAYETSDNNGQIMVDAQMDNYEPELDEKVSVAAKVTPENSKKVILTSNKNRMSIAPNSDFNYPVDVNSLTGTNKNKRLKPGKYTMYVNVKANSGKNMWNLARNFTVKNNQVAKINKKIPNRAHDTWIIIGIIAALIVIGGGGGVIWFYRKNRK